MPILRDPAPFPDCDYIISESTYGGREHPPTGNLKEQLGKVIRDTVARRGKVIIPAFSVGRTQVIVYYLHQLISEELIEPIPIYVDSPLAVNATEVFRMHQELFDKRAREFLRQSGDILGSDYCTYVRDVEDSKAINKNPKPCVIISASGMCEAGRIRHHLKNNVGNGRNTVLIVGFQAAHTLGRRIVEKQKTINIFGQNYELKAQVETLNGFSGHADRAELLKMLKPHAESCRGVMLVHGEESQMFQFADALKDGGFSNVVMPHPGECFQLDGTNPPTLQAN
jgi:metallo-beta-lactamase family protein